jgi:hypothetical protein
VGSISVAISEWYSEFRGIPGWAPIYRCVRELVILTTARELDSRFEWAAHEPEALPEGIPRELIENIGRRLDTSGLDQADAVVIDLGREIFGARRWPQRPLPEHCSTSAAVPPRSGRSRRADGQLCRNGGVLTAFDIQLDTDQP